MKIGYPCINQTVGCKGDGTFRLKSYSEERLIATVESNLGCLLKMLQFNVKRDILFFRVTSDLVPFASHPICEFRWQDHFRRRLTILGDFIRKQDIRISMHPGQFVVINSVDAQVFERSVKELEYHIQVLDSLRLRASAKVQIHIGGVYGDKGRSMRRFLSRYQQLDEAIRRRLVIENDDRVYNLRDCLQINAESGIPVLFDVFHHSLNNSGETVKETFELFTPTWKKNDGSTYG
jgi:UV DNA damage endonuclease